MIFKVNEGDDLTKRPQPGCTIEQRDPSAGLGQAVALPVALQILKPV